jgi:membrane dipeptidase
MRTALLLLLSCGAAAAQPLADPALEARARAIHDKVIALDTHVDIPLDFATAGVDPGGFTEAQVDLPKMRAGGLDAAFFIVYTPQGALDGAGYAEARRVAFTRLAAVHRFVNAYPYDVALARDPAEVRAVAKSGRKAALIGMENAFPLGPQFDQAVVDDLAGQGVRYVGVTHNGHNQFGDSANPNRDRGESDDKWGGLSPDGKRLVGMLNRAGIMVDVSHAGRKTMLQIVELSDAPVIASHSGARAVADSPRNLDDEQLRALAARGGVAQMVALDSFVKPFTPEQIALRDGIRKQMKLETSLAREVMSDETRTKYEKRLEGMWEIAPRANVADFVNHIDHAVKVAGIDHVGIASDFDGGGGIVGWEDASETLNVTRELVKRGYTRAEIEKLWGGNLLRVLGEARKTARRAAKEE